MEVEVKIKKFGKYNTAIILQILQIAESISDADMWPQAQNQFPHVGVGDTNYIKYNMDIET